MSRAEIAAATEGPGCPRDPDGAPLYPGRDRVMPAGKAVERMAAGESFAWRLNMEEALRRSGLLSWQEDSEARVVAANPAAWGDVIVARKETLTSYHLSVVVDDAAERVTHVVRGRDLYHATSVHVLLQRLLGLPTPRYHHHRLIVDANGRKLSKSDRDTALAALRAAGKSPADIRRVVGL
jgi:glutamyl-Q tRNA(Asp) synthetase